MKTNLTTARYTMNALADAVAAGMQPPGRGHHTAATLRQTADIAGDLPLSLGDAALAYLWLGQPYESDDAPIAARRKTCIELSQLAVHEDESSADVAYPRMADVLDRVVAALDGSDDPRHRAIAATAAREAAELRRFVTVI